MCTLSYKNTPYKSTEARFSGNKNSVRFSATWKIERKTLCFWKLHLVVTNQGRFFQLLNHPTKNAMQSVIYSFKKQLIECGGRKINFERRTVYRVPEPQMAKQWASRLGKKLSGCYFKKECMSAFAIREDFVSEGTANIHVVFVFLLPISRSSSKFSKISYDWFILINIILSW